MKECKAKRCSSFKINVGSKLSRTLSTDGKRALLLLQPCWIRTNELQASVCRIVRVVVFPSLLVLWLDIKSSQILARGTGHSHQTVWQIEISSTQGSMGIPRLMSSMVLNIIYAILSLSLKHWRDSERKSFCRSPPTSLWPSYSALNSGPDVSWHRSAFSEALRCHDEVTPMQRRYANATVCVDVGSYIAHYYNTHTHRCVLVLRK